MSFLIALELSVLSDNHPFAAMLTTEKPAQKSARNENKISLSNAKLVAPKKLTRSEKIVNSKRKSAYVSRKILHDKNLRTAKLRSRKADKRHVKKLSAEQILHRKLKPLFDAIRHVESHDRHYVTGDEGRSKGCYQISQPYWKDACKFANRRISYHEKVWSQYACERIMIWYWKRYCPDALAVFDFETLARTHNGGPAGARKYSTKKYWRKVRRQLYKNY